MYARWRCLTLVFSYKPGIDGEPRPHGDPSGPALRERGAERQDRDGGRGEALLVRRPALLPPSPLGPAQPPQRGGADGGGPAAAPRPFPNHGRRLAGFTQVRRSVTHVSVKGAEKHLKPPGTLRKPCKS